MIHINFTNHVQNMWNELYIYICTHLYIIKIKNLINGNSNIVYFVKAILYLTNSNFN